MYSDYKAFLNNDCELRIPTIGGLTKIITVPLNMPVKTFCHLTAVVELIRAEEQNTNQIMKEVANLVTEILRLGNQNITNRFVINNLYFETMISIMERITVELTQLLTDKAFTIPPIEYTKTTVKSGKTNNKRNQIETLSQKLNNVMPRELTEQIAIVSSKTANSYFDIIEMPILVFRNTLKTIIIDENKTNEDWHLAYLNYLKKDFEQNKRNEIKSETKLNAQTKKGKGANLAALKQML